MIPSLIFLFGIYQQDYNVDNFNITMNLQVGKPKIRKTEISKSLSKWLVELELEHTIFLSWIPFYA